MTKFSRVERSKQNTIGRRLKEVKNKGDRNTGIDFLRIISTFSIILLHIMGHGGIRDSLSPGDVNYYVIWFMMIASFCSVNCYALISGYVGYHEIEKPHKSSRFVDLWLQVVFYCVIMVIVFTALKKPDIGTKDFIEAFFPIIFKRYWYFSAYLGVFIFMPLINKCIREFTDSWLAGMTVTGILAFSFFATIAARYSDPLSLNGGYSAVWLIFLYFIGGIIKKYKIENRFRISLLALTISVSLVITWVWKVALISIVGHGIDDLLIKYISPTILLMSVCQLLLFSKLKFNGFMTKLISITAQATFGIYLFQDSDYFRKYIVARHYTGYALKNPLIMVSFILLTGLVQFSMGLLVDKCRSFMFGAIHTKRLSDRVGGIIDGKVSTATKWLEKQLHFQENS